MMRHAHYLIRTLLIAICLWSPFGVASERVVNVYIWSAYLPQKVITLFYQKTGIRIHLTTYSSNQQLYAKLKTDPHAGYDLIVPSSYTADLMLKQHMLQALQPAKLHGVKHLNQRLFNLPFDPGNRYTLPYLWGNTGIIVNDRYFSPKAFQRFADFWRAPGLRNQLMLLNDPREVFAMALHVLGYSINDRDPKHIKRAYLKLKHLLPRVKLFNSDATQTVYMDEDAVIGMCWNGDAYLAMRGNTHLHYLYPKDGITLWIDSLAIPRYAPHVKAAYQLINFLLQPKIAAIVARTTGYSSANADALAYLPKAMRDNPVIYPSDTTLAHATVLTDVGSANALYQHYWTLLKLGA